LKLEFLDDISDGGKYPWADPNQLVRLYDFDQREAIKFRESIITLIETGATVDVSALDFIESLNCQLTLSISLTNDGIATADKLHFICKLTKDTYKNVAYLLEPFCEMGLDGYQWMYDLDTSIDFLFSPGGTW
jgi:hypothetical protein